ncbi:putative catechol oxidase [Helianthus annuus]|nr:putative catechol oxidase [Helianthus annuus]
MGMMLPAMFEAPGPDNDLRTNPLFDPYRNVSHAAPAIVDLQFDDKERGHPCVDQVSINLCSLHTQMIRTKRTEVLEDLEAEEEEYVLVTLVPRAGTEDATVSEIKIELLPID